MTDRQERHFTLHIMASGVILDADDGPPDFPERVRDVPDEQWRELGSIDATTGRAQIDWTRASRWRPLAERWRW